MITKATLARELDQNIEFIYPKTSADIVVYDLTHTVKDAIDELKSSVSRINASTSTNDFSNAYKDKLDGIEYGATRTIVDEDVNASSNNALANRVISSKFYNLDSIIGSETDLRREFNTSSVISALKILLSKLNVVAMSAGVYDNMESGEAREVASLDMNAIVTKTKNDILGITDGEILDAALDTIKEIQNWIIEDQSDITSIFSRLTELENSIGNGPDGLNTQVSDINNRLSTIENAGVLQSIEDTNILKTIVGDNNAGIIRDIADINTTIGDDNSGITQAINNLEDTVYDSINPRVTDIESTITTKADNSNLITLQNTVDGINNRVDTLETTIGVEEGSSSSIIDEISTIKENINSLDGKVNDNTTNISGITSAIGYTTTGTQIVDDVNNLKIAVGNSSSGLIKKVNEIQSDLTTSNNNISSLSTRMTTAESNINTKASQSDLTSIGNSLGSRVSTLETTVGDDNSGLVKNVNSLNNGLGSSADVASATGTTAWSRIKNLENTITTKAAQSDLTLINTNLDSRISNLETTVGDSSSGLVYIIGDNTHGLIADVEALKATSGDESSEIITKLNNLENSIGYSTDAANANGTTAWSRILSTQSNVSDLNTSMDSAEFNINNLINRVYDLEQNQNSSYDDTELANRVSALEISVGKSSDAASASGTSVWSRIKNLEDQTTVFSYDDNTYTLTIEGLSGMVLPSESNINNISNKVSTIESIMTDALDTDTADTIINKISDINDALAED